MPKADGTPTDEELNQQLIASQDISQNPRMQAMAAIASANEDGIAREHADEGLAVDGLGNAPAPSPAPSPAPAPAPAPKPAPAPGAAPAPAAATVDDQLMAQFGADPVPMEALDSLKVKVKIDGQERVVTLHELRRTAQLDGAAHARLEEANRLLHEARTHAATTATQPPVGVAPAAAPGQSSPASKDVTAITKQLVGAIFEGDEGKAAELLGQVLAGNQQPAINAEEIAARVVPVVKQQLSVDEANAQFRSDFKEIVADPMLAGVADQFFVQAQQMDPQKSYAQLLDEAGTETRKWMSANGLKTATEPARGSTRQEKLEAKQRIDGKETRGLSRTETPTEPQVESPSQVIAAMRQARGLT